MNWRRPSLTLRLTLLFAIASTIVVAAIGVVFYVSLDAHFLHEDAIELRGKQELVRNLAERNQSATDSAPLQARLEDALVGHHNLHVEVRDRDDKVQFAVPNGASPIDDPARRVLHRRVLEDIAIETVEVNGRRFRVTTFDLSPASDGKPARAILSMNVEHHQMFMGRVLETVLFIVLLGALASAMLGWVAARVGIAPLREFAKLTSRISADQLDNRLPIEALPPEVAELGKSFNAMLTRLEDSFRRLKEFSSDLAHELRTPISALMTQAQVALSRARTADEYREVIYSAMEEYDRLARMTTDMLFLARADSGLLVTDTEFFDVRAEISALFDFYDALAESKQVRLEVTGSALMRGDRIMFRRAMSNLLSNAIRHSDSGRTVEVAIVGDTDGTTVSVTNHGTPIPGESLPRLFDRFYMADQSRHRLSDGAGLGLAITKSIVDAHSGTIVVQSDPSETRFEIRIPSAA